MKQRRVVVTGLGAVTPLGLTVTSSWAQLIEGVSGISQINDFVVDDLSAKIAGTVKGFEPNHYMPAKDVKKTAKFTHYASAAATQAVEDAGLELSCEDPFRVGVAIGSGIGGLPTIEACANTLFEKGPRRMWPFFVPASIVNMAAGYVGLLLNCKGPNFSIATACTSGAHNIGYAARTIAHGDADVMLCGGSEMATCRMGITGFGALRALSTNNDAPTLASRPWDKDRDGFVLGEGAGVMVLEEYERAKARNATIYAELVGFGMSGDAYHMTANDVTGLAPSMSMSNALRDADLTPDQVDYINAHATSTPVGDPAEVLAIKQCFGEFAKKIPVSSTKSMTGHLLGAAGAVEAIFSVMAIKEQVLPPTINLDNPDEGCDLDFIPNTARQCKVKATMTNSFGFGGTNGTLVFSQC